MALLGNTQTLTLGGGYTLSFQEQDFVELSGYQKTLTSKPNIERSTYGSVRYKQANFDYPLCNFKWEVVIAKEDANNLLAQIEQSIADLKENSARAANVWVLNDGRIKSLVIPEQPRVLLDGVTLSTNIVPEFLFLSHKLLFKSAFQEEFTQTLSRVKLEAMELTF